MFRFKWLYGASLLLILPALACAAPQQTPIPTTAIAQFAFEIQTATPTFTPILGLADAPTYTPDPNATSTPTLTPTLTITPTVAAKPTSTSKPQAEEAAAPPPPAPPAPTPAPAATPVPPIQGGEWDFEDGFIPWTNPHGDRCPVGALGKGWGAFTTRDQYGSACMNRTEWKANVFNGHNAQEITFAYVGIQAGVFKTTPTIPGHRYTIEAHMRREFSPAKVTVALGLDLADGADWQSPNVLWFPWNEDVDDAWAKTSVTIKATSDKITIFLKGTHPFPEPGGILRLDTVSVTDLGLE